MNRFLQVLQLQPTVTSSLCSPSTTSPGAQPSSGRGTKSQGTLLSWEQMSAYPPLSTQTSPHGLSSTSLVKLMASGTKVHPSGGIGSI